LALPVIYICIDCIFGLCCKSLAWWVVGGLGGWVVFPQWVVHSQGAGLKGALHFSAGIAAAQFR